MVIVGILYITFVDISYAYIVCNEKLKCDKFQLSKVDQKEH